MCRGELCSPIPKRKPNRLKDYDYSLGGTYFITICTKGRAELLGVIRRGELCSPNILQPSSIGKLVETEIIKLSQVYDDILAKILSRPYCT